MLYTCIQMYTFLEMNCYILLRETKARGHTNKPASEPPLCSLKSINFTHGAVSNPEPRYS